MRRWVADRFIGAVAALQLLGCATDPVGPPLRPKGAERASVPTPSDDCAPLTASDEDAARTAEQRRPQVATAITNQASNLLASSSPDISSAAQLLVQALEADPYHVQAIYQMARVQALAKRPQCASNLLQRIYLLAEHETRRNEAMAVLASVEREPAFAPYRDDPRFMRGL